MYADLSTIVQNVCKLHEEALATEKIRLQRRVAEQRDQAEAGPSSTPQYKVQLNSAGYHNNQKYWLDEKTDFEVWHAKLTSELGIKDLLDVINPEMPAPPGMPQPLMAKRKMIVKDIIINRIDQEYNKRILGIQEPREILKKLNEIRKNSILFTPATLKTEFFNFQMGRNKSVANFCDRFDECLRGLQSSDPENPITDREKTSVFYKAIIAVPMFKEIRRTNLIILHTTQKEMSLDDIKRSMRTIEMEETSGGADGRAKASRAFGGNHKGLGQSRPNGRFQGSKEKKKLCHRCSQPGHWMANCPLAENDLWLCNFCKKIGKHKARDCRENPENQRRKADDQFGGSSKRGRYDGRGGRGGRGGRSNGYGKGSAANAARPMANENNQGKRNLSENLSMHREFIQFVADSGATDHIVGNSFILSDFKISENGLIKSANKNDFADIAIDGRGDLLLKSNLPDENFFKLTNVIAAKDISENLLSLRRLADAGFQIHLDDKSFKVLHKENDREKLIFQGQYEKPNWVVRFEVKRNLKENGEVIEVIDDYVCKARVITDHEQSQTVNDIENPVLISEGEKEIQIFENPRIINENLPSELGRENSEYMINEKDKSNNEKENSQSENESVIEKPPKNPVPEINNLNFEKNLPKRLNIDELETFENFELEPYLEQESLENLNELFRNNTPKRPRETIKESQGMIWHRRLGHASLNYLRKLQKVNKLLENVKFDDSIRECEICAMAKMEKLPFNQVRKRASRPLELIHTDTMGVISPTSWPGQKKYIVTFIDDFSRYARVYCIKTKDQSGDVFEKFLMSTSNLLGENTKVCYVRSDNGTEFTGGKFMEIMNREKIEPEYSPPATPQHNGVAERFNKTIEGKVRAYMCDSGIPETMCEFAVEAAVHSYNITPHKSIEYNVPTLKFAKNSRCNLEQMKRFGCIAYVKLPKREIKFGAVAIKSILVGYLPTGYLLWHPNTRRFIESRHVRFNEKLVYRDTYLRGERKTLEIEFQHNNSAEEKTEKETPELEKPKKRGRPRKLTKKNKNEKVVETNRPVTRSSGKRKLNFEEQINENSKRRQVEDISSARYTAIPENEELAYVWLANLQKDPTSFEDAMNSSEKEHWSQAVSEELNSMKSNEVWKLVNRPKIKPNGRKPNIIDSKWVFKRKTDIDGSVKYKARLVLRGFKDKNSYDLKETYAPVSRLSLIRASLAIINKYDLLVCQMDVKTAFLNGELEDEVFMEIPDGLDVTREIKLTKVCKIEKSMYGLKVSPKKWNETFSREVEKMGLQSDLHDPCLFTWRHRGKMAFIVLYVDDMLLASNDPNKLREIKDHLNAIFDMKDLGEPRSFLGMTVRRDKKKRETIIHQAEYTERLLEKFYMRDAYPRDTPMETRQASKKNKKSKTEKSKGHRRQQDRGTKKVPYREAIGGLMYLANATRPDIAFAVNFLARNQLSPTEDDWNNVKRIFAYLKGTIDHGLRFTASKDKIEAMTDSSCRDCPGSVSTSGYVIKLFGDTIAWRSHKQKWVTLSSCFAEYLAMSESCQELLSLDKSIRYIIGDTSYPIRIWCDNSAAVKCTEMDGSHKLKTFDETLEQILKDLEEREGTGVRKHMSETHGDFIKECVDHK